MEYRNVPTDSLIPYERNPRRNDQAVDESSHIRQLDAQKESGKAIFGSGYLVSEKKKDEKVEAEREKAEREKAERWQLSEREMEIVRSLG